jgi:hypothetical protein
MFLHTAIKRLDIVGAFSRHLKAVTNPIFWLFRIPDSGQNT